MRRETHQSDTGSLVVQYLRGWPTIETQFIAIFELSTPCYKLTFMSLSSRHYIILSVIKTENVLKTYSGMFPPPSTRWASDTLSLRTYLVNKPEIFVSTSKTLDRHCINVIQMFCFCWDVVKRVKMYILNGALYIYISTENEHK